MAGNPIRVSNEDAHTNHHAALEDRVLTGKTALVKGKQGQITVDVGPDGTYTVGLARPFAGGAAAGGYMGEYDPTKSYSAGQTFKVSLALTIRAHVIPIGIWAVRPAASAVDAQGFGPWAGSLPANPATASTIDMDKLFFDPANPPTLGASPNDKLYAELLIPLC